MQEWLLLVVVVVVVLLKECDELFKLVVNGNSDNHAKWYGTNGTNRQHHRIVSCDTVVQHPSYRLMR